MRGLIMRRLCRFTAAVLAFGAANAASLSQADLQIVLKNAGLKEPGRSPVWYLDQDGDGKSYEQGGIAWVVYAFSRPYPLTPAFCVTDLVEIKVDATLRVLRTGMRRKIALRPCSGVVPIDFRWLHGFEDLQVVPAINAVLAVAETGSAQDLTVRFDSEEARAQAMKLDKKRLLSVTGFGNETTVMFASRWCGQPLVFPSMKASTRLKSGSKTASTSPTAKGTLFRRAAGRAATKRGGKAPQRSTPPRSGMLAPAWAKRLTVCA